MHLSKLDVKSHSNGDVSSFFVVLQQIDHRSIDCPTEKRKRYLHIEVVAVATLTHDIVG